MPKSYVCSIQIDVEAENPLDAAREAEDQLRNPECLGWVVHCQTDCERPMLIDNAGGLEAQLAPPLPSELTRRELATVLVALSNLQDTLRPPFLCGDWTDAEKVALIKGRYPHLFADCEPLNEREIDNLCDKFDLATACRR